MLCAELILELCYSRIRRIQDKGEAGCSSMGDLGQINRDKVLLIACGALAKEIIAIKRIGGWRHLELTCLPAQLHLHPEKIPAEVEKAVNFHREKFGKIFVVYADCGTGGLLQKKCRELGVEMVEGAHCYAFFDGLEEFEINSKSELRAFYLTDFLVRQFDSFVWRPLGLDRHPELRDAYFGNYEKLVYLAQTNDEYLDSKARNCADRLSLRYVRRYTGYGDLPTFLGRIAPESNAWDAVRDQLT